MATITRPAYGTSDAEAFWAHNNVEHYIFTAQLYEDAMFARRAYDRLRETRREWDADKRRLVDVPASTGWEREVLERQILHYVLTSGYFPSKDHVKALRENMQKAKRSCKAAKKTMQAAA